MQSKGSNLNFQLKGISIYYDDLGESDIPIVFIHGFPFDKTMWKPQIEFLKTTNRIIAYDIRGFGKSTTDNQPFSINLFADDLKYFIEGLGIKKIIGCGLSMGGYILLNAINRYPELFHAIILCDTQCISDSAETKEKRKLSISQIENGGLNDFAKSFVKNVFFEKNIEKNKKVIGEIENTILTTSVQTITGTLNALANRSDLCSSLHTISVPTLILCGNEDKVTPPLQSEFMQNHISGSIYEVINMAGHLSNLDQPEEFNNHVKVFVAENIIQAL